MTGVWIALEGGEGCGKSTQAARLATRLGALLTREPGGTALGAALRSLLLDPAHPAVDARAEALLMAADRAQHVAEVVGPALAGGRSVVSDRSVWSSLAYQGHGRGLDVDVVRHVSDWATAGRWPDLAVLVAVPEDVARTRRPVARDRMEAAGHEFHARVAAGFAALAAADPDRWAVVDGTGAPDEVEERIVAAIAARYPALVDSGFGGKGRA